MYWVVLLLCLGACLFKRETRLFALVMVANAAINDAIVKQDDLYHWVSAVDASAFILMALLTWTHTRKWWAFLVTELAFAAVAIHAIYWTLSAFGLYLGEEYQTLLNGAFILSALILTYGGFDVGRFIGSAWCSLTLAYHLRSRLVHSGAKSVQSRKGEE